MEVRRGDIADQSDLDAVVNAANTELWMGAGVAGAIKRRGGAAIEKEAMRQAPIRLGDAVITGAGSLPNRFVIHAAAMGFRADDERVPKRPGSRSSAAIIRDAVLGVLRLCDEHGIGSVGMPALATGVAASPIGECAEAMSAAVALPAGEHAECRIDRTVFVLHSEADRSIFAGAIAGTTKGGDPP